MVDFISSTELACQGQRSLAKRLFYQRNENGQARLEGVYEARSQATESVKMLKQMLKMLPSVLDRHSSLMV